jgi:hypothetical protein
VTQIPSIWLLSADIMSQLGGGFRQQRWCEYILREGYAIRLFAVEGAFRVRFADVRTVAELAERRREWIAQAPVRAGVRDTRAARAARLIKHVFLIDLLLPSLFRLLLILNATIKNGPPKIVVLCSSPPFGMALVGRLFKILHPRRVKMVLDMRDLWSLHTAFPGPKAHKRSIEKWVISGSDLFTTVAPSLADRFEQRFGARPEIVYNIATQVQVDDESAKYLDWSIFSPLLRDDTIKIVYTGSIPAGFYDLEGFLLAIKSFGDQNERKGLQFVFVGAGGELANRAQHLDLPDGLVIFVPQQPHTVASQIQCAADVLLFLGYLSDDNQGQVSIKLFEYFRRGHPILPIHIRPASDVDNLIARYCGKRLNLMESSNVVDTLRKIGNGDFSSLPRCENSTEADNDFLQAYMTETKKIISSLGSPSD